MDFAYPERYFETTVPIPAVEVSLHRTLSDPLEFHCPPRPHLVVMLSGEAECTVGGDGGETRVFKAGDVMIAEDTTGQGHSARFIGQCVQVSVVLDR